jgi:hypothetical protein
MQQRQNVSPHPDTVLVCCTASEPMLNGCVVLFDVLLLAPLESLVVINPFAIDCSFLFL